MTNWPSRTFLVALALAVSAARPGWAGLALVDPAGQETPPRTLPALEESSSSGIMPSVEVRQRMPESTPLDTPVPIEIIVLNSGPVAVEDVIVTDRLGPGTELVRAEPRPLVQGNMLVWLVGRLEPGQESRLQLTVSVRPESREETIDSAVAVQFHANFTSQARVLRPKLDLSIDGPPEGRVGEPVQYAIRIHNEGRCTAANVVLRDAMSEGFAHPHGRELENVVGMLGPGESREITLTVTPTQAGRLTHRFLLECEHAASIERTVPIESLQPALELSGTGPKHRLSNRPCEFSFIVHNPGRIPAKEASLTVQCPPGIAFIKATQDGRYDPSARTVTWALGDLEPGGERRIQMTGRAASLGSQTCRAVLRAQGSAETETACTTTVVGVPALHVEVLDLEDPIEVASQTVYEIRVVNQGSAPATNVRIRATVPDELAVLSVEGPTSRRATNDRILEFEPVSLLAPQADVLYRVKVEGTQAGSARFHTTIRADQFAVPISEEESTTVFADPN